MTTVASVGMHGMHNVMQQLPAQKAHAQATAGAQKPAENTPADVAEDAQAASAGVGQNLDKIV